MDTIFAAMDRGDWIQLLVIVIVFMILVLLIYSYAMWPLWVAILNTVLVIIGGYFANRFIKL